MTGTASGAAPTADTTNNWPLLFAAAGMLWFVYMLRPESEAEKRYYKAQRGR